MKKVFAIVLGIALMLASFTATAVTVEAATKSSPMTIFPYDSPEQETVERIRRITDAEVNKSSDETIPDGQITSEMIENWSGSWKEFVNMTLPLEHYDIIENVEDQYCMMLIRGINRKRKLPIYNNREYISLSLGGLRVKKVQLSRLLTKFHGIINLYNKTNKIQLVWEPKMLSEEILQVDVNSTNVEWIEHPAQFVGQKVRLKKGAIYWESSWNNGSCKYCIANDSNGFIPEDYIVTVNGFSYLDENRTNITESYYTPYNKLGAQEPSIQTSRLRMLHICTETTDLGWVYAEEVARTN